MPVATSLLLRCTTPSFVYPIHLYAAVSDDITVHAHVGRLYFFMHRANCDALAALSVLTALSCLELVDAWVTGWPAQLSALAALEVLSIVETDSLDEDGESELGEQPTTYVCFCKSQQTKLCGTCQRITNQQRTICKSIVYHAGHANVSYTWLMSSAHSVRHRHSRSCTER